MKRSSDNPLRTRQDLANLALSLIEPLKAYLTPVKSRLMLGQTGAYYDEGIAGMEGYSRVLWALVPLLKGRFPEAEALWALWKQGLISGTDPESDEYWGTIGPFDQRMVEMAVMGMALCLIPERFYFELNEKQRDLLYNWLDQINHYDMPLNNWRYFRVLVNTGFMSVGRPYSADLMTTDLDILESHYEGSGWYYDKATQRDYYTMWAFHYYGLLYSKFMKGRDPERCERFRERARLIAPRFACWFDSEGMGLPYGRSLTYRFAQSSFFSAMALCETESDLIGYGEIKGFLLRNLRAWMKRPILDSDGILTIGYGYPSLVMTEGYNSPCSPYWCMKVFAPLALPEDHPFWLAEEKPYDAPYVFCDEKAHMLITRDAEGRCVTAYTAGNHAYEHTHEDEKYEKFAYSTRFAFSVAKEAGTLSKGAFDSMLAVLGSNGLWHGRCGYDSFEITEDRVYCMWSPEKGVTVETTLIPVNAFWHIRRHRITSDHDLQIAEGGFSIPADMDGKRYCERKTAFSLADAVHAVAYGPVGTSAVFAVRGYTGCEVIRPDPNTNILFPRSVLPMLRAELKAGVSDLCCAVFASDKEISDIKIPQEVCLCY